MFQHWIVVIALCLAFFIAISEISVFGSESLENDQSQLTWKTFKDRSGVFSIEYPSNWAPSGVAATESSGPVDILFIPLASIAKGSDTQVEFVQYAQPSPFNTARESLESELNALQNDPDVTKFEIERPIECDKYTLSGLPACSVIYEIVTSAGGPLAIMIVDSLESNGTENEVYYRASYDLFESLLPTVEDMIDSFQLTGSNSTNDLSSDRDFSLNDTGTSDLSTGRDFSLNDTTANMNTTDSFLTQKPFK